MALCSCRCCGLASLLGACVWPYSLSPWTLLDEHSTASSTALSQLQSAAWLPWLAASLQQCAHRGPLSSHLQHNTWSWGRSCEQVCELAHSKAASNPARWGFPRNQLPGACTRSWGRSRAQVCELAYSKATSNPARWVLAVPEDSHVQDAADLSGTIIASELVETTRRYFAERGVAVKKVRARLHELHTPCLHSHLHYYHCTTLNEEAHSGGWHAEADGEAALASGTPGALQGKSAIWQTGLCLKPASKLACVAAAFQFMVHRCCAPHVCYMLRRRRWTTAGVV